MKFLISVLVVLSVVSAHWEILSPTSRGFDDLTETNSPCGGFNTPNAARDAFLVKGSTVSWLILDGSGNVTVYFATGNNPSTFSIISGQNFQVDANGPTNGKYNSEPIDLSSVGVVGQNGTIQMIFYSDEVFYQCLDITFVATTPAAPTPPESGDAVSNSIAFVFVLISLILTILL